jgi:hypothetical protein
VGSIAKNTDLKEMLPEYTSNPKEAGMSANDISAKKDMVNSDKDNQAVQFVHTAEKERKEKFGEDYKFEEEAWFKNSEAIISNPESQIKSDCLEEEKASGTSGTSSTGGTRGTGAEVYKHTVTVKDTRVVEETKKCDEPVPARYNCQRDLSLKCEKTGECDAGGIVKGELSANVSYKESYPIIKIGTIDKVRLSRKCGLMNKRVNFKIKNKHLITEFKLGKVDYSDYIRISLNGTQVLNTTGGKGAFKREHTRHSILRRYDESTFHEFDNLISGNVIKTCNTKKWYKLNPDIDLISYLKEGDNYLDIELAFGNAGRLYMELVSRQHCCDKWIETWTDGCEELRQ